MKTLRDYINLINEGGVTLPNPDGSMPQGAFTAQDQVKLNQRMSQQAASPASKEGEDVGNGFVKIETEVAGRKIPAIKDTQSGSVISRNFDPATGGAIFRSIARYIVDGKLTMQVGPETQAAVEKALGK